MNLPAFDLVPTAGLRHPRIGFLGVGWIGRHRMEAMIGSGAIEAAAIADPSREMVEQALALVPDATVADGLDGLLKLGLDGIVIATPSALHAGQAIRALDAGCAVFCQKPLGRSAAEAQAVVEAARRAERLLAVDLSYRFTDGMQAFRHALTDGAVGRPIAVDLTFHNAYGPDKPWFYDPDLAGGGCLMDLGVHLVDLALGALGWPEVVDVQAHLRAGGRPVASDQVEDYAVATLTLEDGTIVRLACSWRLPAGRGAVIGVDLYGTAGGLSFRNVGGSFYDFEAVRMDGTRTEPLSEPGDAWGGRAAEDWAVRLAAGEGFDPEAERLVAVARVLDRIYAR